MLELPADKKLEMTLPFLIKAGWLTDPSDNDRAYVAAIIEAAGDRIKAAGDILDYGDFFTADGDLRYDEKAFEKRIAKPEDAVDLLAGFRDRLADLETFDAATTEAAMRAFIEERSVKFGQIIHAVRVATTGKPVGFGMFEILEILGRERVLARIDRALGELKRS
jgi:glutamyl-tRNA synthetase